MPFSEQIANKLADLLADNSNNFSENAPRYVALHSADCTPTCDANELAGDGYARTLCTFSLVDSANGVVLSNDIVLVFPQATATKAGQVSYFSVWDSLSGGTPLMYGALTAPANWTDGNSLALAVNALAITVVDK